MIHVLNLWLFEQVMEAIQFLDTAHMDTKVRWNLSQHQENQISAIKLPPISKQKTLKRRTIYYFIILF